jgi:hypothetical protein
MFADKQYEVVKSFLSSEMCLLIHDYMCLRKDTNTLLDPDDRVPFAGRLICDMLLETILKQKQAVVERLINEPVWPSYTYARVHSHGASMSRHTDRPGSEIGMTVAIAGDKVWPIWFRTVEGDVPVALNPGDGVIYRGCLLPHWRETYDGEIQIQCMFFYVAKNGPCAAYKFNGRKGIGLKQPVSFQMAVYQRLKQLTRISHK